jgi:hypothetical protein
MSSIENKPKSIIDIPINDQISPVRQNINIEFLSSYLNKIKLENNSAILNRLKNAQETSKDNNFKLNRDQFFSSKWRSAVNYVRNEDNHRIS